MTTPPPERDPLTLILAVWGAALGTLTAAWNIYRDYTNKGRLRVHCYIGWIAGGGGVDRTDRLVYSVTNVGRQPVMVTHLGGHSVGGDRSAFMIVPHDGTVPRMLAPGEYLLEYTEDLSVFDKPVKFLAAWDSLDRAHKCSRRDLKRILNEVRKARVRKRP